MKLKLFAAALCAAAGVLFCTGCGKTKSDADTIRIGVSIPAADHGWTGGIVWWAEQAKKTWEKKDPKYFFAALLLAAYAGGFACAQFRTISVSEPKFKTASKTVSVTGSADLTFCLNDGRTVVQHATSTHLFHVGNRSVVHNLFTFLKLLS